MATTDIILQEAVDGLGDIGDIVRVKPGYARNYLIPKGLAVIANARNVKELEHNKRMLEAKRRKVAATSEALRDRLAEVTCTFTHRVSEEGRLFGSVTSRDIQQNLAEKGIDVDRKKIVLDDPIKALGEYQVPIKLPAGVQAQVNVVVQAQENAKAEA